MTVRERIEEQEEATLSPYATLSKHSKGRKREEAPCDLRPVFQRDRDRILHCKAFRRLKSKTQVFLSPSGDHYRTRMTHTLEVSQIARTIARALRLNEDLTEAIALGHDLGHTPYGHAGERVLNEVNPAGFRHNEQSVRVVECLEKDGQGLNLTEEVLDGMLNHRTSGTPHTLEGQVVRLSDKIAYCHHDMDDAIRGHIICEEDVPSSVRQALGATTKDRLDYMIHDIVAYSMDKPKVSMSPETEAAAGDLRQFLFEAVYASPVAKGEEGKALTMIAQLYEYYLQHIDALPDEYLDRMRERGESEIVTVCDYIAGMTDSYALTMFQKYFIPESWKF